MIETVFLALLSMCIPAGVFILAVMLLHKLKVPHRIFVVLWLVLGLRLLFPVTLKSPFSFYGFTERYQIAGKQAVSVLGKFPHGMSGEHPAAAVRPETDSVPVPGQVPAGNTKEQVHHTGQLVWGLRAAGWVWLCGMFLMLSWGAASYIRLRSKVRDAVRLRNGLSGDLSRLGNVWQSDWISSPFLFGVLRPRIYIPFHMKEEVLCHVLAHEYTHMKNKDHIVKFLWFIITAMYWFHPLVWAAYILLGRDIELACDEQVISRMDSREKACYADALLQVSTNCSVLSVYPIAFGKAGVKMRIKHVLNYKKPAAYIISLCIIAGTVLAFGLLTDAAPKTKPAAVLQDRTATQASGDLQPVKEESVDILTKVSFGSVSEIDLDGDGMAETVSADLKKGIGDDALPELTISGKTFDSAYMSDKLSLFTTNLETGYYYFLDLDTSDSYVEIAFFEYGPSGDPYTYVLRYTGGSLLLLGGFTASPEDSSTTISGDGTVNAVTRCDIVQTDWVMGTWKLTGETLKEQELEEGEFFAYHERYGSDYPVTAKRDFHAFFANPLSSAIATVKKGTEVAIQSFKKSKDSNTVTIYFYYEDENGKKQHACFDMEEGNPYKVLLPVSQGTEGSWELSETTSLELFEGLSFAG